MSAIELTDGIRVLPERVFELTRSIDASQNSTAGTHNKTQQHKTMNTNLTIYIAYFLVSLGMTIWVARTLHKNGRLFLVEAFSGNQEMADSVNRLLWVGFYLINLGFILLFLRVGPKPADLVEGVEYISTKLGIVLLVLGGMHFVNMFSFSKLRKRGLAHRPPPVITAMGAR